MSKEHKKIAICVSGRLDKVAIDKISKQIAEELNKPKKYEAQASLKLGGGNGEGKSKSSKK